MDSSQIPPPPSACTWSADKTLYPKVVSTTISDYTRFKRQGRKGQYCKAQRIFYSRKIKTVKIHKDGEVTFVKAIVIKSFGQETTRPAVLIFKDNNPVKGHCEYPIGKCGICCHTIALMLFLEYFSKHKVCLFALTCTQKMQTWHKKGRKSSMATRTSLIPLKAYRNASSTRKPLKMKTTIEKSCETLTTTATDNDLLKSAWLKRDVGDMSSQIMKDLDNRTVQQLFYKTLRKFSGIKSGLSMQLHYNNSYNARIVFNDHDYCKNAEELYDHEVLRSRFQNLESHDVWHSDLNQSNSSVATKSNAIIPVKQTIDREDKKHILMYEHQSKEVMHLLDLLQDTKEDKITVSLPNIQQVRSQWI